MNPNTEDGFEDVSNERGSECWKSFHFNKSQQKAKCLICNKILKASGGSTKGLIDHLLSKHNIDIKNTKPVTSTPPSVKKRKMTHYFAVKQKMSLETKVSRLCALSCLSFKKLATDVDLREAFQAQGYEMPKNWKQIKNLVLKKYAQVVDEVKNDLALKREDKIRGSITTDEYTSGRNRRFINVNFHHPTGFESLGVPRAYGSMPAEKQIQLISDRLQKYGLDYSKDIIGMTTDGASVMEKMGEDLNKEFGIEHFICLAHTLHLVVGDIFYKKKETISTNTQVENVSLDQAIEDEITNEIIDDNDDDAEELAEFQVLDNANAGNEILVELISEYKTLVAEIRRTCKLFKKSPVKNDDNLQVHVRDEKGKELSLLLDCRTRWNTMLVMLIRFNELKNAIKHALIDMNETFNFTDEDLEKVKDIIEALTPVKLAVEKLCRRDATLVKAERVLELTLNSLKKSNTEISTQIHDGLVKRVMKRRNSKMIHLMHYLEDPDYLKERKDFFGVRIDENAVKTKAIALIKRLFFPNNEPTETQSDENELEIEDDEEESSQSLEQKFEAVWNQPTTTNPHALTDKTAKDFAKVLRLEMSAFEKSGTRSENLEDLYQAMKTIPPTSVESERAFSAVGLFATKLRSSLGDNTIDALLTLRTHFKSKTTANE